VKFISENGLTANATKAMEARSTAYPPVGRLKAPSALTNDETGFHALLLGRQRKR